MAYKGVGFILFYFLLLMGDSLFCFSKQEEVTTNSKIEEIVKKYSSKDYCKKQLEKVKGEGLKRFEPTIKRYENEKELDKIINSEKYRKIEQLKHNEKELYRFASSARDQGAFDITVQNQDIYKSILLFAELTIEWKLYKKVQDFFARRLCTEIIAQRKIFIEALEQFGTSLEGKDEDAFAKACKKLEEQCQQIHSFGFKNLSEKEMVSVLIPYVVYAQIVESIQRYYFLNHCSLRRLLESPLQSMTKFLASDAWAGIQKNKNDKAVSALDFMLQQANTPALFSLLGEGYAALFNDFLEEHNFLPDWSNNFKFFLAKQIIFVTLFVRWSVYKFYYPLMLQRVFGEREKLIKILREYDQQKTNVDRKKKENELYDFFETEYGNAFPSWLASKSMHYGLWRTGLNVAIMLPAAISSVYKIYQFIKSLPNAQPGAAKATE